MVCPLDGPDGIELFQITEESGSSRLISSGHGKATMSLQMAIEEDSTEEFSENEGDPEDGSLEDPSFHWSNSVALRSGGRLIAQVDTQNFTFLITEDNI